ncbi:MAG: CoB--CoM heterodisulfide reductase subunit C [Candidatus Bathyarchaeota archaeon]|nr:MAG: CoB--CoM heterodisulfide reductase subunit C [Candidatus Bathyarchaeota archaeon]
MVIKRDLTFRNKILSTHGGETLQRCYQCGSCTGGCPTSFYTSFRVRKIVHQSLLGLRDDVLSGKDIWMCTVCFTCQERCPTGVEVTDLMLALRNLATEEGYAPALLKNVLKFIFETGHEFPFTGYTRKLRRELGLSETPPLTIGNPKALEEIQKLMKMAGATRLLKSSEMKK